MTIVSKLIKIKKRIIRYKIGKVIVKLYHYLVAIPSVKFYSAKFSFVKKYIPQINFYSTEETFRMLREEKKSLSRFGDGEISWIYRDSKGYFGQENSEKLSVKLKEIILSNNNNVLIAIPNFFDSVESFDYRRKESRNAHLGKYYKRWLKLIDLNKTYTDALITRVYMGLKKFDSDYYFNCWMEIWKNKNVIIVEGNQTRFGVGNDLLRTVRSVKRVIAPSENAFSKYDEILDSVKDNVDKNSLVLVSLGPTASVLAYDLACLGFQAIDIGHLDIEYEWFKRGALKKIPIEGKYVNEAGGKSEVEISKNNLKRYQDEIIFKISNS